MKSLPPPPACMIPAPSDRLSPKAAKELLALAPKRTGGGSPKTIPEEWGNLVPSSARTTSPAIFVCWTPVKH